MMGYNEAGQEQSIADTFEGKRKLRPLVPRPFLFPTGKVNNTCTRLHGPDIFSLHQHQIGSVAEQGNNNEAGTHQVVVSSRWNPTPEQLRALEELYRGGTRTPSAEQIQHITAQLRRYGKIEGKNVFYWFQNHKARERQKRRREVQFATETTHFKDPDSLDISSMTDKGSGATRVSIEHEQNKNLSWAPFTSNGVLTQESESDTPIKGIEKESAVVVMSSVETRHTSDGWIQFDAREFQHHHHHNYNNPNTNLLSSPRERNTTWKFLMQPTSTTSNPSLLSLSDESNHNLNHYNCPRSFPLHSPTVYPPFHISPSSLSHESLDLNYWHEERERKSLTLELLPLVRADGAHINTTKERECPTATLTGEGETNVEYNAFPYYKFL